ncbi:N-acetylglucosamine kinase [Oryzifoliimicrobium ureilyticus]|uniref:N-acetylglucosamine kinase n=1 Tax=Oryzifoliimicrobium ureilyticus TaxID=3113724 RepID=UPI0030760D73
MSLIFGLDSGGSKTIAAVADLDGRVLDFWHGPGLDPMAGEGWIEELGRVVSAFGDGQIFAAAVLGLSCHGEIDDISALQQSVARSHFAIPHLVLNDVEVACDGAFAGSDGILLLAGTGSMAWAKRGGLSSRYGGWGEVFGDEGSAFWIGREALSLATRVLDGRLIDLSGEGRVFADSMLEACGVSADGLMDWAFHRPDHRAAHAALARTVSALSNQGNGPAKGLLKAAAERLVEHVTAARHALADPNLAWSYAGGVFRSSLILAEAARLAGAPLKPKLPPIGGALWRAAVHSGQPLTDHFLKTLATHLEDHSPQQEIK